MYDIQIPVTVDLLDSKIEPKVDVPRFEPLSAAIFVAFHANKYIVEFHLR